jgi:sarcosine oxidase subunit beta
MSRPDVVVVGAGIVGLSIAVQLVERGASVTVVDRSGIGAGASGIQPGGVRQQWGTRINCLLARESMSYFEDVRERLHMRVDPGFEACGYLFLAHSHGALDRLRENVALQNELGVPSRIVAPLEAAELAPGLDAAHVTGGAFCAQDGYFDRPHAILEALAAMVDVQIDEALAVGAGGHVRLSRAGDLDVEAVIVAAGVDTPHLLPELPIQAESRYLFLSDPVRERLLEPLVVSVERRLAAKHLADGRLLVSDLAATGDPETEAPRWRAAVKEALEELLPRLVYVPLPLLVAGIYDVTPDHQAILGQVRDRIWVAAGFSGHGFMHAPAVGRIIAEALVGGREDEALRLLDAARFDEGRPVEEPQVV